LHQAAAGGQLECTKCLMARGADVLAKNDRGHRPYDLCTQPEVQALLRSAMETPACKATGRQFSSTVLRYLCSASLDVFCEAAVHQRYTFDSPDSTEKEKPVTWCTEVLRIVEDAEHQLQSVMQSQTNELENVTAALEVAAKKPVDCKLLHQCQRLQAKLESEIQLRKSMVTEVVAKLEDFTEIQASLTHAIEDAKEKEVDAHIIQQAKLLRRRLVSEASLMRAVNGPQKTTPGHLGMLEDLTSAAKAETANPELVTKATRLIAKLRSEREVRQRVAEAAPLCEVSSFKDTLLNSNPNFPAWSRDTEQFSSFHDDYKRVVEQAEKDEISPELMQSALDQFAKIELLLIERKQFEDEQKVKATRKKKKSPSQTLANSAQSALFSSSISRQVKVEDTNLSTTVHSFEGRPAAQGLSEAAYSQRTRFDAKSELDRLQANWQEEAAIVSSQC